MGSIEFSRHQSISTVGAVHHSPIHLSYASRVFVPRSFFISIGPMRNSDTSCITRPVVGEFGPFMHYPTRLPRERGSARVPPSGLDLHLIPVASLPIILTYAKRICCPCPLLVGFCCPCPPPPPVSTSPLRYSPCHHLTIASSLLVT